MTFKPTQVQANHPQAKACDLLSSPEDGAMSSAHLRCSTWLDPLVRTNPQSPDSPSHTPTPCINSYRTMLWWNQYEDLETLKAIMCEWKGTKDTLEGLVPPFSRKHPAEKTAWGARSLPEKLKDLWPTGITLVKGTKDLVGVWKLQSLKSSALEAPAVIYPLVTQTALWCS